MRDSCEDQDGREGACKGRKAKEFCETRYKPHMDQYLDRLRMGMNVFDEEDTEIQTLRAPNS